MAVRRALCFARLPALAFAWAAAATARAQPAQRVPSAAESVLSPAAIVAPAPESVAPAAESVAPAPESVTPAAESVTPAAESAAPGLALVEPSLAQVKEAAQRRAAGTISEERSRTSRARSAHWAPVVRAQVGVRDDGRTRRGQIRLAPLIEDDLGESRTWALVATWDLAQVVYARDEAQLALAHVHLARVRQEAVEEAIRLYEERWRVRAVLRFLPPGVSRARADALLALLRATAGLDGLTSGLYAGQLAQVEAEVSSLEALLDPGSVPAPAAEPLGGARKQPRLSRAQDRPAVPTPEAGSPAGAATPPPAGPPAAPAAPSLTLPAAGPPPPASAAEEVE